MSDEQEPIVSEGEESTVEEMRAVLREYYIVNEEYQKAICVGEQCQRAVDPWYAATHLRNTHKVSKKLTRRISKTIREGTIRSDKGIPEDGTLPQEGLPVFDGFRCVGCGQFKARSVQEVEGHCQKIWHEETKYYMIERVRLQSWGGRDGADQRLWVVDEDKCSKSEDERVGENSNEESEEWVEEDSREDYEMGRETERLKEWVGDDANTWRWREAECGRDEMAGEWVVMSSG
ncbi:hypothetical protein V500_01690 [Pseudogymnoascus sp. VKM F-4518 (FW-2643)]|nr:hypothetical protein V500_01690 [Pseudogymnoascus sp. VKM F-4518 (FW-2643)]